MKYQILTYNQISAHGLHRFPTARYAVGKSVEHPDAIVLRSHDLRTIAIPASVKAIGRALKRTEAAVRFKAHMKRIALAMK